MTTKTLKPSGGDFSTLAGWIAYLPATLTAPEQLDVYIKSGGYDENNAISSIVTTTTNRLIINVPTAERGNGTPASGAYLTNSSANVLRIGSGVKYLTIDGLEIKGVGVGAYQDNSGQTASDNQHLIQHALFRSNNQTFSINGSNQAYIFRNVIGYTDSSTRQFDPRGCASMEVSNCVFFNRGTDLGMICDTESTIKNTYSGGSSSADYWSGGSPSGNNNSSSDTSATSRFPTASINSIAASSAFVSTTSGSEDFRTKGGFTSWNDLGATLAALTDDFIGTARPQGSAYDIGIIENIVASGATIPVFMGHYMQQGAA